ncbi:MULTISPECIES: TRAP transporter permease [Thalassospira]|jgi:TRAP transporter 4TM/12TM fusion protein|uniref:Permease n=1 Tax=Thalassospira xiamenensis TaxID=220697 RepID=A0ABR5XZA3_9PROT|nr:MULTISPECIES: TRAP transporter permease [Thalassospira]KZD01284.1 permease [Thalassospira xiamenensis]KZD11423.1 permease [Thalassospira xiamenensis]MAB31784.1 permease [Thalassospira sp.]MAL27957.1 permease [Thalassospira sp.]MBA06737.1 permease [Thalassospira sp.]|tara:strand:- start:5893 stop:7908 length:2016 start_codon:yes stop_codon:yes gene_type:complete
MSEPAPLPSLADKLPQPKLVVLAISVVAVALSLFQMYGAGIEPLGLFYQRSIHLAFVMFLAFLMFPVFGSNRKRGVLGWVIDLGFLAGAFITGFYLSFYLDEIFNRAGFWTSTDLIIGIIATVTVLEASRRAVGLGMTVIGIIAIVYALSGPRGALPWLGEWLPGILSHRGADVDRLVGQLYLGQEGIYGLPMGVAATYIFMFVLFGAFLEVTGAGKFFIDMAYAATGRKAGGPAKAAVLASAGMGSISGSAIANVVTTGAFTIPLMKKLGYRPAQAGGIEAAASTGGQITPPLMGAGAFLISEYTQVPYLEIVMVSIFPAILYLGTVYLFVHIVALKNGMRGMPVEELPDWKQVLKEGWQFILPLGVLIYLLVLNISPMRVGFWAIISVLAVAALRYVIWFFYVAPQNGEKASHDRLKVALANGVRITIAALELGAKNAVAVSMACAVAGIIVGVVGLTGLGLKFSSMMIAFSGGHIVLALVLVLIASLILGMGLPVTASYIVLIVLVGPALSNEFGIPLLIAHLVVFWYSQDSNVTPPIALAGFAGAAIAGASPLETSMQAWKFAKGLYLIPAFMVFNPEIITGGPLPLVLWTGFTAILSLAAFAAALEGFMFAKIDLVSRILIVPATIGIFYPDIRAEIAGTVVILAILGLNWWKSRHSDGPAAKIAA